MIRQHIIRTLIFGLVGLAIGFGILATSQKVYESRTILVLSSQNPNRFTPTTFADDVERIVQAGMATNPNTETEILMSPDLFFEALSAVAQSRGNDQQLMNQYEDLVAMYDVRRGSEDSAAAQVIVRAYDKDTAAALANQIALTYNDRRRETGRQAMQQGVDYLKDQVETTKGVLTKAEQDLRKYLQQAGISDALNTNGQETAYLSQLKANRDTVQAELRALQQQVTSLQGQIASMPETEDMEQVQQKSAVLQQLQAQLADLQIQRQALLEQYLEDAIQVKAIDRSIANTRSQIQEQVKFEQTSRGKRPNFVRRGLEQQLAQVIASRDGAQKQLDAINAQLGVQEQRLASLPASNEEITRLQREVRIQDQLYERLKAQQDDLQNRVETSARAAAVLYQARPNPDPVLPRPSLVLLVSFLGGAIFGLLFSYTLESLRLRVYSSTQLQQVTGLPVIGVVPELPTTAARRLLGSLNSGKPIISERYRYLAFAAVAAAGGQKKRILFTGLDNRAGTSTSAAQFAAALANTGVSVVLVDGSLENPTVTRVFGLEHKAGVSDILAKNQLASAGSTVGEATNTPNLTVVPAGNDATDALKTAPTPTLQALLQSLSEQADFLVIDTPSTLGSSDAARLVPYVDDVYLVTSAKTADMKRIAAAIDILTLAGAPNIKFVMTKGSRSEEAVSRPAYSPEMGQA